MSQLLAPCQCPDLRLCASWAKIQLQNLLNPKLEAGSKSPDRLETNRKPYDWIDVNVQVDVNVLNLAPFWTSLNWPISIENEVRSSSSKRMWVFQIFLLQKLSTSTDNSRLTVASAVFMLNRMAEVDHRQYKSRAIALFLLDIPSSLIHSSHLNSLLIRSSSPPNLLIDSSWRADRPLLQSFTPTSYS